MMLAALAACAALLILFLPAQALAATPDGTVDLTPLIEAVVALAAAAIGAVGSWAIARLAGWLKLRQDSEIRAYLDAALTNALEYGAKKAMASSMVAHLSQPSVRNEAVELAIDYTIARVPDALRRFQITPAALREMLEARLYLPPPPNPTG